VPGSQRSGRKFYPTGLGDEASIWTALSTNAATVMGTWTFGSYIDWFAANYNYNATVDVRSTIYLDSDHSVIGTIDGIVDMYMQFDAGLVASVTMRTAMQVDATRLHSTFTGATISAAPVTGGFTISATRPTDLACHAIASWWIKKLMVVP
jgi:hypothetical protein